MYPAEKAYKATQVVNKDSVYKKNPEWFKGFYAKLREAIIRGEYEITDVFISHKIKAQIKTYLMVYGYSVKEQKLGNTFTIGWKPINKK